MSVITSQKKVGICGITGRMGQSIAALLETKRWPHLVLLGGTGRSKGRGDACGPALLAPEEMFEAADIVIDFSHPDVLIETVQRACAHGRPLVMGTTGLGAEHWDALREASQTIPILYASNTSLGVALLTTLLEKALPVLEGVPDLTVDILDVHHQGKKDAPSGTAQSLAQAVHRAMAREEDESTPLVWHDPLRASGASRPQRSIGIAVQRSGANPGEHTVTLAWGSESLGLQHKVFDRKVFAEGAIQAAEWLASSGKTNGLFAMTDVFHG